MIATKQTSRERYIANMRKASTKNARIKSAQGNSLRKRKRRLLPLDPLQEAVKAGCATMSTTPLPCVYPDCHCLVANVIETALRRFDEVTEGS